MNDIYEYTNSRKDIPQTKYLFVRNEASEATKQAIYDTLRTGWIGGDNLPLAYKEGHNVHFQGDYISALVWRLFNGSTEGYWKKAA